MQALARRKQTPLATDERGYTLMTPDNLRLICIKDDLYETPIHNEKLYLNFKGFTRIENLEQYFNLRALWLNNNAFTNI
jgi:hypothetical protein